MLTAALAVVIVGPGLATLAAPTASAGSCQAPQGILGKAPKRAFGLPGGARVKIWDTGKRSRRINELRIVAVRIPAGTLVPRAMTAPSLSRPATPQEQAAGAARAVVVVNGATFDPSTGTPMRSQVLQRTVRKGSRTEAQGVALYEKTRSAAWTLHRLTGSVTSRHGGISVGAVNWQSLASRGVSLYTREWGSRRHPAGPRTVVVRDGRVKKILRGSVGTRQPARGQIYLTARSGSADLQRLARLRVGDAVQIRTGQSGVLPFREGRPGIGKPNSLIGVSSAILRDRENRARCGARDELLRPRSALGWAANGDMIVATASGRATVGGVRSGGATAHQWVSYLKQLGAVNAVNLDGGTSTTLLVRRSVGGKLQRLDRSAGDYQRPVPDVLTFRVP